MTFAPQWLPETASSRRPLIVVVGCLIVFSFTAVSAILMLYEARRIDWRDAEQAVINLASTLDRDIGRTTEAYDLSLLATIRGLSFQGLPALAPKIRDAVLFDGTLQASHLGFITVLNREGRPIYGSRGANSQSVRGSGLDYFRAQQVRTDAGLYVGVPFVDQTSRAQYLSLSRRVNDANNEFAGVALAAIRLSYLQGLLNNLELGDKVTVSFFRSDGILLARRPFRESDIGISIKTDPLFTLMPKLPAGTFVVTDMLDGVERLYAYRHLDNLPLVVAVGLAKSDIYHSWTMLTAKIGFAFLCVGVIIFELARWLRRELNGRTRAEKEVYASAAHLRLILNHTNDMVIHLDWGGTQHFVSTACLRLLGRPADDLLYRSCYEFVHHEDQPRLRDALSAARTDGIAPLVISRVQHGDGTWRHFEAQGRALGNDSGVILVVRDVTERVQMQTRLDQSHRLEAVGRLTAGVAHDFNNVLQALLGGLELALDEEIDYAEARDYLQIALRAGQRGARLTGHLLSFSRQQALRPEPLDLISFLGELSETLTRTLSHTVHIKVNVQPHLPKVLADPAHLDAALLNLALNARDAMVHGGVLAIDASAHARGVVITVTDTGMGMTEEVLARAHEPFFSTKGVKGSGLGLSMVQGFAVQSGGELAISSTPGKGTRIKLLLPAAPVAVTKMQEVELPRRRQQGHVLIVDDDDTVGRVAAALLSHAGYEVTNVSGGEAALDLLAKAMPFDVLVSDLAMPSMNGATFIARARALRPNLPTVAITGCLGSEQLDLLPKNVDTLRKPFSGGDIMVKVERLLDARDQAAQARIPASMIEGI